MQVRVLGASAVAAMILIAGCGTQAPERTGQASERVQGGTVDQTHSYAVGLCIGNGPGQCNYLCSGALIAPNLVVSARHCVSTVPNPTAVNCATDHFGGMNAPQVWITTNYQLLQSSKGWHQVQKINVPANSLLCGNDISLLILAENVPASEATPITPGVQYPMTDHTRYSTTVTAIGYGNTQVFANPQNSDAGTRHIRQQINIVCIPGDPVLDCGNLDASNAGLTENEFYSGDGTCEGDSGSSAFEQTSFTKSEMGGGARPISFGVLSRGGEYQTMCSGGIYTRLDKWRDLIVSAVKEAAPLGGYPLPAWTVLPTPTPDGGKPMDAGGPAAGQPGATCTDKSQCDSMQCASTDGTNFVCANNCTPGESPSSCDAGYACVDLGSGSGGCFASSGLDSGLESAATTTSPGCAIGRRGPSHPVPWKTLAIGSFALLALRRRRHVRAR